MIDRRPHPIETANGGPARFLYAAALLLGTALSSAGCTLIGMGVGAIADSGDPTMAPAAIPDLREGARITVVLRDSSRLEGRYRGSVPVPDERYRDEYARWRSEVGDGRWLPLPGERVQLVDTIGREWDYEFAGFAPGAVSVRTPEATRTLDVRLARVSRIVGSGGHRLEAGTLHEMAIHPGLPSRRDLLLEVGTEPRTIAWTRIDRLERRRARTGWLIGGAIGLMVDVIVILLATSDDLFTAGFVY